MTGAEGQISVTPAKSVVPSARISRNRAGRRTANFTDFTDGESPARKLPWKLCDSHRPPLQVENLLPEIAVEGREASQGNDEGPLLRGLRKEG